MVRLSISYKMEDKFKLKPVPARKKKISVNKKKLKKAKDPSKSQQPLTKRQELNNHIVCMRNTVSQARVQIINRLISQIQKYRVRKGSEKDQEKAKRKAERLLDEIHALKKVKKDKASLYALRDTLKPEEVLGNPESTVEDRILARLSHHPLIKKDVQKYRDANPNWDMQIPVLLAMTKKKQKPKEENEKSDKSETTSPIKTVSKSAVFPKVEEKLYTQPESQSDSENSDSGEEEEISEGGDEELHTKKTVQLIIKAGNKGGAKTSTIHKTKDISPSKDQGEPQTRDKSEGSVKVKFLTDLNELEEDSDSEQTVDITKAPSSKRPKSAFFVGGVDEPEEESDEDSKKQSKFSKGPFNNQQQNAKPVYRKGKLISKPPPRQQSNFPQKRKGPPFTEGRPDNRFSGNAEPLGFGGKKDKPSYKSESLLQPPQYSGTAEPAEKLHPSWEAKKKQQNISLTAFKGKKITFNDDDD